MKNIYKLFILLFVFTYFINRNSVNAEENINHLKDETVYKENIKAISMYDKNTIQTENEFYFMEYNIIKTGYLIDYYIIDENIYIIFEKTDKYYIEILSKDGETIKKETLGLIVKDSYYVDKFYIVGTRYENATIHIYNKDLSRDTIYDYGGTGYEEFNYINVIDDKIYLFGLKDGISHDSVFANVGNETDRKSFIVTLDEKFKIDKTLYFNYGSKLEYINNIYLNENNLYFILNASDNLSYQYRIDKSLNVLECFELSQINNYENIILLNNINMDKYKIYIYLKEDSLCYDVITNKLVYTYKLLKENIKIIYTENLNGILDVYYLKENSIYKLLLCEYHIDYINNKKIEYNDKTYKNTDHFKVSSFFTNYEFEYDNELNKSIDLSKSDLYTAYYKTTIEDFEIIVDTNYEVLSFINVVNEGVYERGYVLNFSDKLYINDVEVYPGEVLNQTGEVKIKHTTKNETKEFYIYVTDNYYKEFFINYQNADIELTPNSVYEYKLELSEYKEVKNIYVNDKVYSFQQQDNIILIEFISSESNSIKTYNLNYVEFIDGTIYYINDKVKIKTLKKLPIIDIYNIDNVVSYNILDYDQTITDVVIKYYKENELIKKEKTYLEDFSVKLNDENIYIEVILQYEDGSNNIYEDVLFQIKASSYLEEELLNIKFDFNEDYLSKINIKVNDSLKLKVLSCETNDVTLLNYITNDNDLNVIMISVITTFIFIITTIIILFLKKRKKSLDRDL